jgi:site-specific recombinase XerD
LLADFHAFLADNRDVADIQPQDVRAFLVHCLRRPKGPGHGYVSKPGGRLPDETLAAYYRVLSSFFHWCKREKLLKGNWPMENVGRPGPGKMVLRTLRKEEVERLLALVDKPGIEGRNLYLAFSLMALGLRTGEVSNLRLAGFGLDHGAMVVRGKGDKERELPVPKDLADLLQAYVSEVRPQYANGCDRLLASYTGAPLLTSSLRKSFKRYAQRAGIRGTPHTLRHSFATEFIRQGGSVFVLQHMLGHEDLETTERYVHVVSLEDKADALARMDWV